tara:strand:- start:452 stop:607 length:156 start_codon:yes stop_codon:yes gene_type:complete
MSKKEFVSSKGETWEWEETDEVRAAVERLHKDIRDLEEDTGKKTGDYGVGK